MIVQGCREKPKKKLMRGVWVETVNETLEISRAFNQLLIFICANLFGLVPESHYDELILNIKRPNWENSKKIWPKIKWNEILQKKRNVIHRRSSTNKFESKSQQNKCFSMQSESLLSKFVKKYLSEVQFGESVKKKTWNLIWFKKKKSHSLFFDELIVGFEPPTSMKKHFKSTVQQNFLSNSNKVQWNKTTINCLIKFSPSRYRQSPATQR